MNSYFELLLCQVPRDLEDIMTEICFSFGASGTEEVLQFTQDDAYFEGMVTVTPHFDLKVFFQTPPSEDFWSALTARLPEVKSQWLEKANQDWMEEWKKGFVAFPLVDTFWIVPSWLKPPKDAKQYLFIDPGMAFGTGTHATTQMAAQLLFQLTSKAESTLDVGTGTGILAMMAQLQGAKKCIGIDIDPEAIRVARENAEQNNLSDILWSAQKLDQIEGVYDVVIANIIDGVLLQLRQDLVARMAPEGYLIVSGILAEREADFVSEFIQASHLKIKTRLHKDEWLGFLLQSE